MVRKKLECLFVQVSKNKSIMKFKTFISVIQGGGNDYDILCEEKKKSQS